MNANTTDLQSASQPTAAEIKLALESSQRLTKFLSAKPKRKLHLRVESDKADESISIPASAVRLLNGILSEMAKGNAVTLIPVNTELTTQQAADLLNVSRPFIIERLEKGEIPFRKVGTHRRIRLKELLEFKRKTERSRLKALEELSEMDQQLGLGY